MKLNWKSLWILGVALLFLLAGYLLQELSDDGDGVAPDVPDSELTPRGTLAPPDLTRAGTIVLLPGTPGPATQTPGPTGGRDLELDERQGGHTIARHVGKTDGQLRERLEAEPDISAASSYTDLATAQRVVQAVLDAKRDDIETWEDRTGSRANLVLRMEVGETIGRSVKQGRTNAVDCDDAVVVLRWQGNGWYVLTSYPEDR